MASAEIENIFNDILERAKIIDPANARKWFDKLTICRLDGGSLKIGCPDEVTVRFLQDNCKNSFTHAAQHVTGHLVTVDFNLDSDGQRYDAAKTIFHAALYPGSVLHTGGSEDDLFGVGFYAFTAADSGRIYSQHVTRRGIPAEMEPV